jgi:hypothetical protein
VEGLCGLVDGAGWELSIMMLLYAIAMRRIGNLAVEMALFADMVLRERTKRKCCGRSGGAL